MYCGKCGFKNKDDNNFCTKCGAELDKESLTESNVQDKIITEEKETNIEKNIQSNNEDENIEDKKISTIWLDLITAFWFFLGIYNVINGFVIISENKDEFSGTWGLLCMITGAIQATTFFLVHVRQKLGYYFFIIGICMSSVINTMIRLLISSLAETNDYSFIVITGVIVFLIYGIPNIIYIRKRKSLFGIKENDEEW